MNKNKQILGSELKHNLF